MVHEKEKKLSFGTGEAKGTIRHKTAELLEFGEEPTEKRDHRDGKTRDNHH